jgi:hypothetical protein
MRGWARQGMSAQCDTSFLMAVEFGCAEWDETPTHLPAEVQNRIGPLFQFGVLPLPPSLQPFVS